MQEKIKITAEAIMSLEENFKTQIILQRHCNYEKSTGELLESSVKEQERIVKRFISQLENQNLNDVYFLFLASNTKNSNSENQRCIDTTDIAMNLIKAYLEAKGMNKNRVINLNENLNYKEKVKQTRHFAEPQMFLDHTGYLEFLKEKNRGMNAQFWIDFESDTYKEERERRQAEGPDEIVKRAEHYLEIIETFAYYFHKKKPNSKLIIWCGTHYDVISPLAKQTIFDYEKEEVITVDYCGGISYFIDDLNNKIAKVNSWKFPVDFQDKKQPHRHF